MESVITYKMGTIKTKIEELELDGKFTKSEPKGRPTVNFFDALDGYGPAEGDNDRGGKVTPTLKGKQEADLCE